MNFIVIFIIPFIMLFLSFFGFVTNRKNVLLIILCVELSLLSLNFCFLLSSFYLDDMVGQIFAILILTVASAETSIGLAILIVYYRVIGTVSIEHFNRLKN